MRRTQVCIGSYYDDDGVCVRGGGGSGRDDDDDDDDVYKTKGTLHHKTG